MPSLSNIEPTTPAAPNDITTAESYVRLENFLNEHAEVKQFKVEDDRHGMGMVTTFYSSPVRATNIRLSQRVIRNFMLSNGFQSERNK
ncbi:unnamed protein product [Rhizopus stolonifer]